MFTCSMRSRVPLSCLLKKNDLELDSDPTTRTHSFPVLASGQKGKHCNTHNHTLNTNTVGILLPLIKNEFRADLSGGDVVPLAVKTIVVLHLPDLQLKQGLID